MVHINFARTDLKGLTAHGKAEQLDWNKDSWIAVPNYGESPNYLAIGRVYIPEGRNHAYLYGCFERTNSKGGDYAKKSEIFLNELDEFYVGNPSFDSLMKRKALRTINREIKAHKRRTRRDNAEIEEKRAEFEKGLDKDDPHVIALDMNIKYDIEQNKRYTLNRTALEHNEGIDGLHSLAFEEDREYDKKQEEKYIQSRAKFDNLMTMSQVHDVALNENWKYNRELAFIQSRAKYEEGKSMKWIHSLALREDKYRDSKKETQILERQSVGKRLGELKRSRL